MFDGVLANLARRLGSWYYFGINEPFRYWDIFPVELLKTDRSPAALVLPM